MDPMGTRFLVAISPRRFTWMSGRLHKLGSMDRISGLFHPNIPHLEVGDKTHLPTIDPNFRPGTS